MSGPETMEGIGIDELARRAGTTTRTIRSLQTLGLLDHPRLRGRTGVYGPMHRQRLAAILELQSMGFSLTSLGVLFAAHDRGATLGEVLGLDEAARREPREVSTDGDERDDGERYGFTELLAHRVPGQSRPLLSIVPTTLLADPRAS